MSVSSTRAALPLTSSTSTTGHQPQHHHRDDNDDDDDDDDDDDEGQGRFHAQKQQECNISMTSVWEIEELEENEDDDHSNLSIGGSNSSGVPIEIKMLFGDKRFFPMPSIKEEQHDMDGPSSSSEIVDCVYVAVGKSESSMNALNYAIKQPLLPSPNTVLYLIHIFPEIKYIPSPLGKLPKSQVNPEQVESFMAQELDKRRQVLQKYIDKCSAAKVKMDTLLIESDMIAKAIVDLIPILNIRKLVLGTNKSNLRKLMSGKGASGIADQVLQSAPQGCEIDIIYEGNQVMINDSLSPHGIAYDQNAPKIPSPRGGTNDDSPNSILDRDHTNEACSFLCFRPKFSQSS